MIASMPFSPLSNFPPSSSAALSAPLAYKALATRDTRFDGRFFVGVTSTGIYCRPVCRVKLPREENCRFFGNAAGAEQAGFRPCLRCRPELAPGLSRTDAAQTLAQAGARWIEHSVAAGEDCRLPEVARRLGVTDRHFRRIFQDAHGVSPVAWLGTQRLLLAKRLLTDTALPVAQVALASGFGSLRRFNAAFSGHYRLVPTALRKQAKGEPQGTEAVTLRMPWRPPYDTAAMRRFLSDRPLPGVEAEQDGWWLRSFATHLRQQTLQGWFGLAFDDARGEVQLKVSPSLAPALGLLLSRVRHLLDLDAEPAVVDAALADMPLAYRPGLRVPGCVDGFETTVRIILGQQVTVAAACTLAGRLVERFGEPISTPFAAVQRLFPSPEALAQASAEDIGTLGIVRTRVKAIQAMSKAVAEGHLLLHPAASVEDTLTRLRALPGIGDWTCELVALRVLAWPDAFPATDAGVIKALGGLRGPAAVERAAAWQPWRAYAAMQLWHAPPPSLPLPSEKVRHAAS
jgi:AraC family transcriptional regulator of adaptative response / DNA-3-methyladenine glycosylase II